MSVLYEVNSKGFIPPENIDKMFRYLNIDDSDDDHAVMIRTDTKLDPDTAYCLGFINRYEYDCDCIHKHLVVISKKDQLNIVMRSLAHELIHVKQYIEKDFEYIDGILRWKKKYDVEYLKRVLPYRMLPWEIEAFDLEEEVAQASGLYEKTENYKQYFYLKSSYRVEQAEL